MSSSRRGHVAPAVTGGAFLWVAWLMLIRWLTGRPRRQIGAVERRGAGPIAAVDRAFAAPIAASRPAGRFKAVSSSRVGVTAWTGLLVGVLAPAAVLLAPWPALALVGTLVFVVAGLGPGITCRFDAGDPFAQAALTFMLSICAFALAATIMIWLASWHPVVLLALAVPSILSCLHLLASQALRAGRSAPS